MTKRLFPLGRTMLMPGAADALAAEYGDDVVASSREAHGLLLRHQSGDWGEVDAEDKANNNASIGRRLRILSAYTLPKTSVRVWVITEADRSATTLLLPDEY